MCMIKIAFIGAGKMAEAMIAPLKRPGPHFPVVPTIMIREISPKVTNQVLTAYPGVQNSLDYDDCVHNAEVVVVAVKPQNLEEVFEQLKPAIAASPKEPIIVSICAGAPMSSFVLGCGTEKIVRSMPNTPATIEQGVTVWTTNSRAMFTESEIEITRHLLGCLGMEVRVDDEKFIDMATSITGSGPAYVFVMVEAMVDTAVHMGFSRDIATTLVLQTILGSTQYAMATKEHPAILKNSVTSPAGTTASAMYTLEKGQFKTVISDAIWSCYRRSLEMGGQCSNVGPGRIRPSPMAPRGEFPDMPQ
uniref:Pyrroline-5-carboxylate reductase n=1 Tax=Eutreptiella gymnastica TaxID=73025 RepID=A0A7S1N595_9EUGL